MTDRVHSVLVVLEDDIREDSPNLALILNALAQVKGVVEVSRNVSDPDSIVAEVRVRHRVSRDLADLASRYLKDGP